MSRLSRKMFSFASVCLLAATLVAPARAQDTNQAPTSTKPAKPAPKKEAKALTFTGKIGAMDKVAYTITLDDKAKRVFQISSDTLISKDGKPAIMADGKVGDAVHGTYRKGDDGKLEALILNYGAKAEPAKPTAKPKKTPTAATNAPASTNAPAM